jgi:hypothetical protein
MTKHRPISEEIAPPPAIPDGWFAQRISEVQALASKLRADPALEKYIYNVADKVSYVEGTTLTLEFLAMGSDAFQLIHEALRKYLDFDVNFSLWIGVPMFELSMGRVLTIKAIFTWLTN